MVMDRDQEERKVKREMMATCALMGILANPQNKQGIDQKPKQEWAKEAVYMADALLEELEKEQ